MKTPEKLAIVMSGGGAQCAYSAGGMKALLKEYGITNPDIIIGGSGSAPTILYYSAGQYEDMEKVWTENIIIERAFSPARFWKILDIDYLVDKIMKKEVPIKVERLKESSVRYFVAVTRLKSGIVRYFGKDCDEDIYEILKASAAVPILYNRSVKIDGRHYIDGYTTIDIREYIKKAVDEGAKTVIAFDTTSPMTFIYGTFYRLLSLFTNKKLRKEINKYFDRKRKYEIPDDVRVIKISPSRKLPAWFADNDVEDVSDTFYLGYQETFDRIGEEKIFS